MAFHPNHLWTYVAQLPTFPQPLVDGEREQWWTRLVISLPSVHRGNPCIPDMAEAEPSVAVHGRVTEATGFQLPSLPWRHPSKTSLATANGFRKHIYFFLPPLIFSLFLFLSWYKPLSPTSDCSCATAQEELAGLIFFWSRINPAQQPILRWFEGNLGHNVSPQPSDSHRLEQECHSNSRNPNLHPKLSLEQFGNVFIFLQKLLQIHLNISPPQQTYLLNMAEHGSLVLCSCLVALGIHGLRSHSLPVWRADLHRQQGDWAPHLSQSKVLPCAASQHCWFCRHSC